MVDTAEAAGAGAGAGAGAAVEAGTEHAPPMMIGVVATGAGRTHMVGGHHVTISTVVVAVAAHPHGVAVRETTENVRGIETETGSVGGVHCSNVASTLVSMLMMLASRVWETGSPAPGLAPCGTPLLRLAARPATSQNQGYLLRVAVLYGLRVAN